MKILLTGASGFIGSHQLEYLQSAGYDVTLLLRDVSNAWYKQYTCFQYDLSKKQSELEQFFCNVDIVIHMAALVHDLSNKISEQDYINTNVQGAQQLIDAAISADVSHFIFLSTIKVHGDGAHEQITENTVLKPEDPYAKSKKWTEDYLIEKCEKNSLNYTIIRTPLVYGAGVKANFLNLLKWVDKGIYLPLKSIQNRRSLIYVENLCDFICHCITNKNAKNQIFAVKDYDVSTPDLITLLARKIGRSPRLFFLPPMLLSLLAIAFGKQKQLARLTGSLTVNNVAMKKHLSWQPRYTLEESIEKTVKWYQSNKLC